MCLEGRAVVKKVVGWRCGNRISGSWGEGGESRWGCGMGKGRVGVRLGVEGVWESGLESSGGL